MSTHVSRPKIDPEVVHLLRRFLPSRMELVSELKEAISASDLAKIRTIGHKLRGSFGLYGLDRLAELSEQIMHHPPSTSLDERLRVLGEIELEINLVRQALSQN